MNIYIEKANETQLSEMYRVFDDSALYDHYFKTHPESLSFMLDGATKKGNTLIARSSKGDIVGVMVVLMEGFAELPYLALLGVKKGYRGLGIGKKLLAVFIGLAEQSGAPNMFIMTSAFNVRARKLYESVGFKKIGIIPNYLVAGIDEIMFVRRNSKLINRR